MKHERTTASGVNTKQTCLFDSLRYEYGKKVTVTDAVLVEAHCVRQDIYFS